MNNSVVVLKIFKSKPHHMDWHTIESYQESFDTQFYYEILVILLLLYTVPSVSRTNSISIKIYRTVENIKSNN